MSVTITYNSIKEKIPKYNEHIIYLNKVVSFNSYGFETLECFVDYVWTEIDENGKDTGNSACFDPDEFPNSVIGDTIENGRYILELMFNGCIPNKNTLWINADKYWDAFSECV